jgi:hypothetical protein
VAQAEFEQVEERLVGRWKLSAVVQTDTDYAACLVTTLNDLGEHLNIVAERPKHLWYLAFAGRDVRLRQGVASDFEITYAIDDNEPRRVRAIPSAGGRVFVQLGQDVALTEPVRRGNRIAFETADGIHAFSLAGSSAALDALYGCAMQHLGFTETETPSDPVNVPSSRATSGLSQKPDSTASLAESLQKTIETTTSPAVEALLVGEIILQEGHLAGYAHSLDAQSLDLIEGYDATWTLPNARAGFLVLDDVPMSQAEAHLRQVSDVVGKGCSSQARTERPDKLPPGIIERLRIYCEGEPSALFILFHRPRGGMYQLLMLGDPGAEGRTAAEQYDDQIVESFASGSSQ